VCVSLEMPATNARTARSKPQSVDSIIVHTRNQLPERDSSSLTEAAELFRERLSGAVDRLFMFGLYRIWEDAKKLNSSQAIAVFREFLMDVQHWNYPTILAETNYIEQQVGSGEKLLQLIKGVLTVQTQILATARVAERGDAPVTLEVPALTQFVHDVYMEAARKLIPHAHSMAGMNENSMDYSRVHGVVQSAIRTVLRSYLPYNELLSSGDMRSESKAAATVAHSYVQSQPPSVLSTQPLPASVVKLVAAQPGSVAAAASVVASIASAVPEALETAEVTAPAPASVASVASVVSQPKVPSAALPAAITAQAHVR